MNNHQQLQQLLAIYDQLAAIERAQVDEHMHTCAECAGALAAYRAMDQGLQQMLDRKLTYLDREPASLQQRLAAAQPAPTSRPHAPWRIKLNHRSPLPAMQVVGAGALVLLLVFLATLLIGRNPLDTPVTAATPTTLAPAATAIVTSTVTSPVVATPDTRMTVRFATYDWAETHYAPLIAAFEEANPDINVETISFQELLGVEGYEWSAEAGKQMLATVDVVDLFISPRRVGKELVYDLTSLIVADPTFAANDFYPNTLSAYQWDGGTWALPAYMDFYLIYYDKDLFDEAGLPYPQPGWRWSDFAQTAQALTQRSGDEVTIWGFVNMWGDHLGLIESQTGPLFTANTTDLTARLQEPAVVEAIQRYADLSLQQQASPFFKPPLPGQETGFTQESTLVELGQAAMWTDMAINWLWRDGQRNVGVVPYPVNGDQQNTTAIFGQGRTMSARSAYPEAAWRWLNFLSHQGRAGYLTPDVFPLRPSLAEANGFWQKMDAEAAAVMRYAIDHSYALPHDRAPALQQALANAIATTLSGETTVSAALANVPTAAVAFSQPEPVAASAITPEPVNANAAITPSVTITYMMVDLGVDLAELRTLAQEFGARQPAIQVVVKTSPFLDAFALPDVAAVADCFDWWPMVYNQDERNAVVNLAPFLAAEPALDRNDFYAGLLTQFTLPDGVWGLPALARPKVIEYNKALFDALGIAYPSPTWTTDDFATLAKQLTQGAGRTKQYGFVGDYYELSDAELFLARRGGNLYNRSSNPPAFAFDQPATVAALAWYADLTRGQGVKPRFSSTLGEPNQDGMRLEQRFALINVGRAGMWTTIAELRAYPYQLPETLATGIVPLPVGVDGKSVDDPMAMAGYYISANSPHPQACWNWLRFLSEQPTAVQGVPARRSVTESAAYRQQVGKERAAIYAMILNNYTPSADHLILSQHPWLDKARPWREEAYTKIVKGEADAAEALQVAQQRADAYRTCVIAANAFTDEAQQQQCVASVVK